MKKLVKILLGLVILIVIALVIVVVYIDSLARTGIEKGATYATGVNTTLDSADVGILSGELTMASLNIANPEGYEADHFLKLEHGYVAVGLASLMEEEIEVPKVELRDINLVVERKDGKNNFDVILDNLKSLSSGETTTEPGKKYVIREIIIEDVSVSIKGFGVSDKPILLPPIKLTDVGSGGEGAQLAKVVGIVIREVLASLLSDPSRLPDMLVGSLGKGLEGLGDLGKVGVETIGKVGEEVGKHVDNAAKAVGEVSGEAGEKIGEAGKKLDEGLKGVGEGLGGLLGGDKKKDEEKQEQE